MPRLYSYPREYRKIFLANYSYAIGFVPGGILKALLGLSRSGSDESSHGRDEGGGRLQGVDLAAPNLQANQPQLSYLRWAKTQARKKSTNPNF